MQRIFSSAPRRETFGRHFKGGRRGGELKIDWTNRCPERGLCVLIAGWISGKDLKGPEAVSVGDCRDGSRRLEWVMTVSADNICPLDNVRNGPRGSTAPVAWSRQACTPQFNMRSEYSLIHYEVSVIAVFLCGLRARISITSMRPW
jgi:hypothetical protein